MRTIISSLKNELKQLRNLIHRRIYISPSTEKNIVNDFHTLCYESQFLGDVGGSTRWLGTQAFKSPLDLWIYQEIIFEVKPDVIVECGTLRGGAALFLASICDLIGHGEIITIDIKETPQRPVHKRIKYLTGSSTSNAIFAEVKNLLKGKNRVMVILDSDHRKDHVLNELRMYGALVTKDSYLIVEDTNLNGHPVAKDFGPGPKEALDEFFKENNDFVVDKNREKFYLTYNPGGYLRKVRSSR